MNKRLRKKKIDIKSIPTYVSIAEKKRIDKLNKVLPFVVYESTTNVKNASVPYQTLFFGDKEIKEDELKKRAFYGVTHLLATSYEVEAKKMISEIQKLVTDQADFNLKNTLNNTPSFLKKLEDLKTNLEQIYKKSNEIEEKRQAISSFIKPIDFVEIDNKILERNKTKLKKGEESLEGRLFLSNFLEVPKNLKSTYLDGLRMGQWMNESNIDQIYDLFINKTNLIPKKPKEQIHLDDKIRRSKYANYVVGVSQNTSFIIVAEGVSPAFRKHFDSRWYIKIERGNKSTSSTNEKDGLIIPSSIGGTLYEADSKTKIDLTSTDVRSFKNINQLQRYLINLQFNKDNLNLFPILDLYGVDLDFYKKGKENKNKKSFVYKNTSLDIGDLKDLYSEIYFDFKNTLNDLSQTVQSWYVIPKEAEKISKENWSEDLTKKMEARSANIKHYYSLLKNYLKQQILLKFEFDEIDVSENLNKYIESKKPNFLKN